MHHALLEVQFEIERKCVVLMLCMCNNKRHSQHLTPLKQYHLFSNRHLLVIIEKLITGDLVNNESLYHVIRNIL